MAMAARRPRIGTSGKLAPPAFDRFMIRFHSPRLSRREGCHAPTPRLRPSPPVAALLLDLLPAVRACLGCLRACWRVWQWQDPDVARRGNAQHGVRTRARD